jgi:hypothetical protein
VEGFGPAQHKEALRQVAFLMRSGKWERWVAADNLRKAEEIAATERATERERNGVRKRESSNDSVLCTLGCKVRSSEPHWAVDTLESHGEPRACAVMQAVLIDKLKKDNTQRLGGHNIGLAPRLLDEAMKAITATIRDYATKCDNKPSWWTKEGGEASIKRNVFDIFDQHNTFPLVNDRSAERTLRRGPLQSLSA